LNKVCKSICPSAHYCLAHRVTTNLTFREHELIEGEPELMADGNENCPLFWDARENASDTNTH
jgi:hypothetical protein